MKTPAVALLAVLWLFACAAGPLRAQEATPAAAPATPTPVASGQSSQVQTELQLERKLLALDLVGYREARTREQTARTRLDEATQHLDEALAGTSLALGTLETLFDDVSTARANAQIAAQRVDGQVQRLQDRMRRISFLEGEVGGAGRTVRTDSVAGRWRVQILPQNVAGVFELRVDGTVVSGTYEVGTSKGSLRGTIVDRNLRLERIDSRGGFDSIFLGTFDPGAQTINGSWTANELASGQPTRGDWNAVRAGAAEERKP
jgi:hypothetical protein